jgi:arsenate reductase (thioredoxin)
MKRKAKVLFFSTGDATRSKMAAALMGRVTDELETASTAVKSVGANRLAEEVMSEIGVDISKQPANSITQSFRESYTVVVTLSDDSKERSPVWPFTRNLVHWNLPDPAAVDGPVEQKREIFRRVRDDIRKRTVELVHDIQEKAEAKTRGAAA